MSSALSLAFARKDVDIPRSAPTELHLEKHADFLQRYEKDKDGFVSGVFVSRKRVSMA